MTLQLQTTGWQTFTADLSNHTLGTDIVRIRFRAESGGSGNDYYNDLLLDDVKIENAPYLGCTDPQACNYDSLANVNDGSCYVLVTIGFGVRNFENLDKAMSEAYRVLKKNGCIVIMEPSIKNNKALKVLFKIYFKTIVTNIGYLFSKNFSAYNLSLIHI